MEKDKEEKIPKTKEAWLRLFDKEQRQFDKLQERIAKKDKKFLDRAVRDFGLGKTDWL